MNSNDKLNLVYLNCNGFKNQVNFIFNNYTSIDLFCFQEYWLFSEECSIFNTNNKNIVVMAMFLLIILSGELDFMWKKIFR